MNNEKLVNKEFMQENVILTTRNILNKEKPDNYTEKSILMMALTKTNIKPLATFGVSSETKNLQIENAKKLGLNYKIYPPNPQGYSEFVVSNDKNTIIQYDQIQSDAKKEDNINKYNQELGKIFGFTKDAIAEHIQSSDEGRPSVYWQEVMKQHQIQPEMILPYTIADMTPASLNDKQAFQKGKEIKLLLDKIDPKLTQKYLDIKELKKEAQFLGK